MFDPVVITVGSFHAGTTDNVIPRPGQVPGHRALLQRRVPDRAGRAGAPADQGHRQRARADRRRRVRDRVPGHRQRRGRGGVRRARRSRTVFGPDRGETAQFPITGAEDFSFVLEEVPGAFVFLGRLPAGPRPGDRAHQPLRAWRCSTTRRWPRAPPCTPSWPCAAWPRADSAGRAVRGWLRRLAWRGRPRRRRAGRPARPRSGRARPPGGRRSRRSRPRRPGRRRRCRTRRRPRRRPA